MKNDGQISSTIAVLDMVISVNVTLQVGLISTLILGPLGCKLVLIFSFKHEK